MSRAIRLGVTGVRRVWTRFNSSPTIRLYIFRAVLLSSISTIIARAVSFGTYFYLDPLVYVCLGTIFHHLLMLYPWRINLFVADLILVVSEFLVLLTIMILNGEFQSPLWLLFPAATAVTLFFSLYFRCVGRTPGRFDLFGKCDSIQPPYSGAETLFGRSALRPLVRGESRVIAVFRAILLACLFLAIPAFGFYSTVIAPIQAEVMTYNIKLSQPWQGLILSSITSVDDTVDELAQHLIDQNITLVFFYTGDSDNRASSPVANVTVTGKTVLSNATQVCHNSNIPSRERTTVVCPFSWEALSLDGLAKSPYLNVSASFPDPIGILYVKIGQGDPSDVDSYAEVTPLAAGSHLSAILTRKRRDLFSNAQDVLGITTPYRSIMMNPVLLLQQDPFPPDSAASLRLRMRDDIGPYATEIVQDYTNASVLNGFATFGGFWTFVNGTFALIFGADLLYFLFRRRSLSALGIVHLFQRRNLTRKWNEDFPALHTEGGHPGSKSAGIVAFLRERLVDLDEDCHPRDPEAQHHSYDSDDKVPRETHSGGIVSETEEIPLSSGFRRHDFHS